MKRNSPEFSHSRPQRQQESKIEGIKTIGIISTPIIWPVKQRPLHFSKNSADDNPKRKSPYSLFLPTLSTPASSEETGNKTLSASTENINLDYTVMNQLPNENVLNYSRSPFPGTSGAADAVTELPVNAAVPLLHSRNPSAELARTLASRLHLSDSEPSFRSPVSSSSSTAYEHKKETLWISSSNSDTNNFMHTSNVLEPVNWWNEPVFHHHITSDIQEDRHFLSSLSVPPTDEKPLFQKSRLDLLDLAPENFYLEMIESNADRKTFSTLSTNSEFLFRKSVYVKDHHSGGITNLTSVEILHAKPTSFFQNMKKSYTKFVHDSQLTNSVQGHSGELLTFSTFLVEPGWTSSAFKHVVTTLPVYQQLLTDTYLKSDSIFISSSNYWSHYLQHSLYFQNPSETLRNGALENNLDAFHGSNENEESAFSILESENMNPVAGSWDSDYLDFPTKYVDISPSLRASFWTLSHHLKEASQVFSGEPSENFWLSYNKLLSSPTERLLSISLYAKSDNISEPTSAIRFLGDRAEEINFSSHVSTLKTQIFSSFIPGISNRISESNGRSISQLQSTLSFANLTVTSNSEFYFDFPFPSLEAPSVQSSIWAQVNPFDQVLENSADSLHMQIQTDIVSDQTDMTFLNNRHQPVSVFPTHSGTQPSGLRDSQAPFLISTPGTQVTWRVKSLISRTRTHKTQQYQSLLENDAITNTIDKPRSKVQKGSGIFLKSTSSMSSDFFPVSLELRQFLHSESKFRDSVNPNSYSTPPLPQSFQNHLDTISPSLLPQWDVEELNLPTTETPRNYVTVLGQNSIENQVDSPRYSLWAVEQEIIDNDKDTRDFAVLTSTNIPRLSEWSSEGEVYGPFSRNREAISVITADALDFENADYGHFANLSSILESSRTAIMNDVVPLPSSYSRVSIHHKETILTGTLTTAAAAIHPSLVQIQTSLSAVTYHESSVSAHIYSLANLPSGTSQNSTSYPPLKQLISSAAVLLPCLCDFFTELGCLCPPEFHHSMSSH